jgi:hypothetical protein
MRTLLSFLLAFTLFIAISLAQTSPPPSAPAPADQARFAEGTLLRAQLDKTIDTKKAKPGDPILAKAMDELRSGSQLIAPKGAKIFGHVVEAAPHRGDAPSTLGIAFDKMELANGTEVPLNATIQAVARFEAAAPAVYDSGGYSPSASVGSPNGRSNAGITPNTGTGTVGANSGGAANSGSAQGGGSIALNAEGVTGISGVSLSPGPAQESVLSSSKHNVKLDGGTQMILKVQ